jgi:DNA-binding GntR family transcriptional regulator
MGDSRDANARVTVYEFVKDKIIKGLYSPGEKLNESEIANSVNVSRTPAREALRALEHEGFVTTLTNKGVFVKKYSPAELDVLHRMLMPLEKLAVEMAASKLTVTDIRELEIMNRRLKLLASEKNYGDYLALNIEFHLFFPKVTGSSELLDTLSQLKNRAFRFQYTQIIVDDQFEQYVDDHQEIIDALRGKGKEKPEIIMERHIDRGRKSFLEFYKKFGR